MFSRQSRKSVLYLAVLDILLTTLGFFAAYETRENLPIERNFFLSPNTLLLLVVLSALSWVLAGRFSGLYERLLVASFPQTIVDTLRQGGLAALALIVFEYMARLDLSRLFLGLFLLYSFLLLLMARLFFVWMRPRLYRLGAGSHILIAGTNERARKIGHQVVANADFGMKLLGFLDDSAGEMVLERAYAVFPYSALPRLMEQHVVDEIIFAVDNQKLTHLEELLLLCDEEGVRIRISVDFLPHVNSKVYLDRFGSSPLLTFTGAPHDDPRLIFKRAMDLVIAVTALIVLAPAFLLIIALIRLTSPGPAIFGQERCGLNGRRFTCYKFRTMCQDAEARKADLAHLNVRKTAFKIPNDPRVTPVGRWLRKFSIDEWPQIWNIVRGEMSIVGPRPPVPSEVVNYERWQRRRLRMRPGLTCLWTLAGRDEVGFDDWMRLDLEYIDNWSLTLDWSIILRTIPYVLTGRGAS